MSKVGRKVGYAERRANPLARFLNVLEGKAFAWVLLIPSLALVTLFIVYPLYRGLRLSLSELKLLKSPDAKFIGLENFRKLLADPEVGNAAINTLVYLGVVQPQPTITLSSVTGAALMFSISTLNSVDLPVVILPMSKLSFVNFNTLVISAGVV